MHASALETCRLTRAVGCAASLRLCISTCTSSPPVSGSGVVTGPVAPHLTSVTCFAAAAPAAPGSPVTTDWDKKGEMCLVHAHTQRNIKKVKDTKAEKLTGTGVAVTEIYMHIIALAFPAAVQRGGAGTEACPLSGPTPT